MGLQKNGLQIVFFTISPNPKMKIDTIEDGKKCKRLYGMLKHSDQHKYLEYYVRNVYLKVVDPEDKMFYVYETNEDNNLHIHGYWYSPAIQTDYELDSIRKTVYSNKLTIKNMVRRGGKMPKDWMNSMVYLTEQVKEHINYMDKQRSIKLRFPDQVYNL